jgi:hypothetical protein
MRASIILREYCRLLPLEHPATAELGIQMHVDLVLEDRRLVVGQSVQQPRIRRIFAS